MKFHYNKYKDADPESTLKRIKCILDGLGIETENTWINSGVDGCYSNRVSVKGIPFGTNGKGTDKIHSETSGYAELMERLQNGLYYYGSYSESDLYYRGVIRAPDERKIAPKEAAGIGNGFMEAFFKRLNARTLPEKILAAKEWCYEEYLTAVPYVSLKTNTVEYLPSELVLQLHGSNGMCAGNTMEEALVQGMAEVFERRANKALLYEKITPPNIPDAYLKNFGGLYDIISSIKQSGKYDVVVKDCSLGKGYPVVASIVIDKDIGSFGIKLGSHPSFRVALERTLTEGLQGRTLEEYAAYNQIGSDSLVLYRENMLNTMKVGKGFYPKELFAAEPSYGFKAWEDVSGKTNKDLLIRMAGKLLAEGNEVFIRDVSFLGFPSYSIIVPDVTELYPIDRLRAKEIYALNKISETASSLNSLSQSDTKRIERYITLKHDSIFENQLYWMLGRPFKDDFPGKNHGGLLLLLACQYRLGDYGKAVKTARDIASMCTDLYDRAYYTCIHKLMLLKRLGTGSDEIKNALKILFHEDIATQVIKEFMGADVFTDLYPQISCWDCEKCGAAQLCSYKDVVTFRNKLMDAYFKNPVSQDEFRKQLIG